MQEQHIELQELPPRRPPSRANSVREAVRTCSGRARRLVHPFGYNSSLRFESITLALTSKRVVGRSARSYDSLRWT